MYRVRTNRVSVLLVVMVAISAAFVAGLLVAHQIDAETQQAGSVPKSAGKVFVVNQQDRNVVWKTPENHVEFQIPETMWFSPGHEFPRFFSMATNDVRQPSDVEGLWHPRQPCYSFTITPADRTGFDLAYWKERGYEIDEARFGENAAKIAKATDVKGPRSGGGIFAVELRSVDKYGKSYVISSSPAANDSIPGCSGVEPGLPAQELGQLAASIKL